jgi:hypothetical protein
LADTYFFKSNKDKPEFLAFVNKLNEFISKMICDTIYLVHAEGEYEEAIQYRIEHLADILESQEGMFAAIATITNFLI